MADVEDMIRRFANNSRYQGLYYKRDDKYMLTTFAGEALGPSFWQQVKSDLTNGTNPSTYNDIKALSYAQGVASSASLPVFLMPAFFWGGETPATAQIQQGFAQYQNIIDGSFYWGIAGVPGLGTSPDQIPSSEGYAQVLHGADKQYMAPITIQFWGANANRYYEYSGYGGMRKMWLDAINVSHPDMVEIITWNDFVEGTYVSPIDDPNKYPFANFLFVPGVPLFTQGYFHTHSGATDFLKYYIEWYKTGEQPQVRRDAIYWAYRTQSKATIGSTGMPTIGNVYGPLADDVYISASLREPADLKVNVGNGVQILHLHEGYNEVTVPFTATNTAPPLNCKGTAALC
jgi:glucan endo-1,3-alpha-glucosidase